MPCRTEKAPGYDGLILSLSGKCEMGYLQMCSSLLVSS